MVGSKFILFLAAKLTMMSFQMSTVRSACPDGRCGSPDTYCPPDSTLYCSLCSDPRLCTFSEERAGMNLMGPFLFSQFNFTNGTDPTKTGSVSVVAQTSRYDGKVYVSGFQVDVKVACNGAVSNVGFNLQTKVDKGDVVFLLTDLLGHSVEYRYQENNAYQKYQAGNVASNCCNISVIITPERYFIISVDCFKTSIGFRPFESGKIPCIYAELHKDYAIQFEPQRPAPSQLCLANNFHIADLKNLTGLSSASEALGLQAALSDISSARFPLQPSNMVQLNTLVRGCPKDRLQPLMAMSQLLRDPQLVQCMSTGSGIESMVNLSIMSLQAGCYGQTLKCLELGALIAPCIRFPSISLFVNYLNLCAP